MVRALSRAHEEGRADRPIRVDDGIRAVITRCQFICRQQDGLDIRVAVVDHLLGELGPHGRKLHLGRNRVLAKLCRHDCLHFRGSGIRHEFFDVRENPVRRTTVPLFVRAAEGPITLIDNHDDLADRLDS
jgi:hypothetical protein